MMARRTAVGFVAPAAAVFGALFVIPLAQLAMESLRQFVPGQVGAAADAPLTLTNYLDLLKPSFVNLFLATLELSLAASLIGLLVAFPLAYWIVRRCTPRWQTTMIAVLIVMIYLSVLVRAYAIEITFASIVPLRDALALIGIAPNSRAYIESLVLVGLVHYLLPIQTLILLGTVQNVDPRLADAAQALGASTMVSHATITLPLSRRGLLSAFILAFTTAISSFVIPMVLGRGRVVFIANMIYNRFSEIANYPSGSAIAIVLLMAVLLLVYGMSRAAGWKAMR